jgi:hypothetical protein
MSKLAGRRLSANFSVVRVGDDIFETELEISTLWEGMTMSLVIHSARLSDLIDLLADAAAKFVGGEQSFELPIPNTCLHTPDSVFGGRLSLATYPTFYAGNDGELSEEPLVALSVAGKTALYFAAWETAALVSGLSALAQELAAERNEALIALAYALSESRTKRPEVRSSSILDLFEERP